jgi:hypothetical protein
MIFVCTLWWWLRLSVETFRNNYYIFIPIYISGISWSKFYLYFVWILFCAVLRITRWGRLVGPLVFLLICGDTFVGFTTKLWRGISGIRKRMRKALQLLCACHSFINSGKLSATTCTILIHMKDSKVYFTIFETKIYLFFALRNLFQNVFRHKKHYPMKLGFSSVFVAFFNWELGTRVTYSGGPKHVDVLILQ